MSRILLADDSPHARRMGELILLQEGHEVVCVIDGETALARLDDVDPDLILADVSLPGKSGYDICRFVKAHPRHRHARVVLLAGPLDPVDEKELRRVNADGLLRKPLEASLLLKTIKPRPEAAVTGCNGRPEPPPEAGVDPERLRAAVTVALDAALPEMIGQLSERLRAAVSLALAASVPALIDEITERLVVALKR
ncbi:MAG: response regulator [Acidobacteriota bacterium]